MEESGHYYTVYYTSLAIGFNEEIAYRHAVLAQMPDEVGWLDAANVHKAQCRNGREYDLNSKKSTIPPGWRFDIEHVLHALPDKISGNRSSSYQQDITRKLLRKEDPLSLEFGLLLHRLGDTYAHSEMGNESAMYTVSSSGGISACMQWDSLGHARHGHDPDHPFLRLDLFDRYVADLYTVLNEKARQPKYAKYIRKTSPKLLDEVRSTFRKILTDQQRYVRSSVLAKFSKNRTQAFFIQKIREYAVTHLGVTMKPYAPERIEKQTFSAFLLEVKELDGLHINDRSVTNAVRFIKHNLTKAAN